MSRSSQISLPLLCGFELTREVYLPENMQPFQDFTAIVKILHISLTAFCNLALKTNFELKSDISPL